MMNELELRVETGVNWRLFSRSQVGSKDNLESTQTM